MAFQLTYANLGPTVISYLQNVSDPLVANMDMFIMSAQRRIAKDCKTLGMESFLSISPIITNNAFLQKPSDWRNTLSLSINPQGIANPDLTKPNYKQLILRSYEYCKQYGLGQDKGEPVYYADIGFYNWFITPTPDKDYSGTVQYMQLPQLIDDENQTNWITVNAPECLIYATLYETASFLQDDPRMDTWYKLYTQAMGSINNEDAMRKQDRFTELKLD